MDNLFMNYNFAEQYYEELLTENDKYLLEVSNSYHEGAFIICLDFDIVFISQHWKERIGHENKTSFIGKEVLKDIIHPDDLKRIKDSYLICINKNSNKLRIEFRIKDKYNKYLWVLGHITIFKNELNSPEKICGTFYDITELKEKKQELKNSQALLNTILVNSIDGVNMIDYSTGKYLFASPAFSIMTGIEIEELRSFTSTETLERIHPEDRIKYINKFSEKKDISNFRFRYRHNNGQYIWFSYNSKLIKDSDGNPLAYVNNCREVSDKVAEEAALIENEKLYRSLFLNSDEAFALFEPILDEFGNISDVIYIYTNKAWELISEVNLECAAGKNASNIKINKDERCIEKILNVLKTGDSDISRLKNKKTGKWYDKLIFKYGDNQIGILYKDVTYEQIIEDKLLLAKEELASSKEHKYSSLFNSIDDGLSIVDFINDDEGDVIDLRFLKTNPAFFKQTGYENVEGKTLKEIEPILQNKILSTLNKLLKSNRMPRFEIENTEQKEWLSISFFNLSDERDTNVFMIIKNITAEKEEKKTLENNLKIKDQIFSNASHELRTPLNVLLGAIQLMEKESNINDRSEKLLGVMKQNCYRLIRLVNNIIDSSKIDSKNMNLVLRSYNIVSLIEDITLSITDYAKDKGIELIFDTEEEEIYTAVDADAMERIILNLLSNSLKFTDRGGKIQVNVFNTEKSILIEVEDTGTGIPDDKLNTIFNRYVQATISLNRRAEGTGIGLDLVKKLVELMGGKIVVQSQLGVGTRFYIELPIRDAQETFIDHDRYNGIGEKIKIEFSDIYNF